MDNLAVVDFVDGTSIVVTLIAKIENLVIWIDKMTIFIKLISMRFELEPNIWLKLTVIAKYQRLFLR